MRPVSRIYILYLTIFISLFTFGCSEEKVSNQTETNNTTNKKIISEKEISSKPDTTKELIITDPFKMYLFNKENTAKLQVQSARIVSQSTSTDENYFQKKRMDSMREYYSKGNYDVARKQAEQLMADPSLSNTMKAEIYFMMAQITKDEYGETSALDLVGKAYDQMKKISEDPEIKQKVNNFNELGNNINEINDFVPPEEPEDDLE